MDAHLSDTKPRSSLVHLQINQNRMIKIFTKVGHQLKSGISLRQIQVRRYQIIPFLCLKILAKQSLRWASSFGLTLYSTVNFEIRGHFKWQRPYACINKVTGQKSHFARKIMKQIQGDNSLTMEDNIPTCLCRITFRLTPN